MTEAPIALSELIDSPQIDTRRLATADLLDHDLLEPEQEIALATQIQAGLQARNILEVINETQATLVPLNKLERWEKLAQASINARNTLMKANQRLVASIASKYQTKKLFFLDLLQEGNIGLAKAADKFDPKMGYRFSTYATYWIRQVLNRTKDNKDDTIRFPVPMQRQMRYLDRAIKTMEKEFERKFERIGIEEILDFHNPDHIKKLKKLTGIKSEETLMSIIDALMLKIGGVASLDKPIDDEGTTLGHFVPNSSPPIETQVIESDRNSSIVKLLENSGLSDRESEVLSRRFGLNGEPASTLEAIGQKLGVTRERIRQIEKKALEKLNSYCRATGVKPSDFL